MILPQKNFTTFATTRHVVKLWVVELWFHINPPLFSIIHNSPRDMLL